jgi:hypothetical protein
LFDDVWDITHAEVFINAWHTIALAIVITTRNTDIEYHPNAVPWMFWTTNGHCNAHRSDGAKVEACLRGASGARNAGICR